MQIQLKKLKVDPKNPNQMSEEYLDKLTRHIEQSGQYPRLIVRPTPGKKNQYTVVDGHQRLQVLTRLGYEAVECDVWDVTEAQSELLLLTLNRLQGEDDVTKRARLFQGLLTTFDMDMLSRLVPESTAQIKDLLSLATIDFDDLANRLQEQTSRELQVLPVSMTFMVQASDVETIEAALALHHRPGNVKKRDKNEAFLKLCLAAVNKGENRHE